ncbi:hypothetical protein RchiOBHm_Chr7g0241271 [Rosa chinensis]|uniref:Glycosyltransferase family 92 protein n=1 Tax=Rosa chinensis TaxID=74649 RepID=A0A2P6PI71_ROSCH|nr:hypothetical protein RchiOBHm_Chr7g0241271 [Rosa chinensis]
MSSFFYKPCNYELFVKQSLNMEMAIVMARDAGMDWIIHLDTDELLHPAGAKEYSLRQLLLDVPGNVDMVIFSNYESSVERDDIKEPFTEFLLKNRTISNLQDTHLGLALFHNLDIDFEVVSQKLQIWAFSLARSRCGISIYGS